jgi:Tfp pilus assembly protein PilF
VTELLKEIRVPNLTADEAFNRTRLGVSRVSKGDQIPWFSSSLAEEFSFGPRAPGAPPPAPIQIDRDPPKPPLPDLPKPPVPDLPKPPVLDLPRPPVVDNSPPPDGLSDAERALVKQIDADPAMKELTSLIVANPNDQAAFYKRGQLYAVKGAYRRALMDFNDALRLNPRDVEALNNRCWVKMIVADATALKDCNDALSFRPNFADALDSRGLVNLKNGQNANAVADFDAALRLNPKLASSLYGRGLARQKTGAGAQGERDIAAARAIDPNISKDFDSFGIR